MTLFEIVFLQESTIAGIVLWLLRYHIILGFFFIEYSNYAYTRLYVVAGISRICYRQIKKKPPNNLLFLYKPNSRRKSSYRMQ